MSFIKPLKKIKPLAQAQRAVLGVYGIKNCDTIKKAINWLDDNNVEYVFHDYKKQGLDEDVFNLAIEQYGWENVINKRGTSWRNLSDGIKNKTNNQNAIALARENPSIVKRPLVHSNGVIYLGFKADAYADIFG